MAERDVTESAVDLILQDDPAERARLEAILQVGRDEMVDFFIKQFAQTENPIWLNLNAGTAEERLQAVRAYFRNAKDR